MSLNTGMAVIGCAVEAPVTEHGRSLEELLHDAALSALADAGLGFDAVDGIVVAANDQLDGRAISIMAASGSVGGVDRDILSTPSAGEHAFVMGALRVASGQYRTQLVMAWNPTEVSSFPEAERLGADPYYHRRLPLDELSAHALQASALKAAIPQMAAAAKTLDTTLPTASGSNDIQRWPLARGAYPTPATGVAALVLASEDFIADRPDIRSAWLHGMGWATEAGFLGDRDLSDAPALDAAVERAYAEAGIADPETTIDVAEISDSTAFQQLLVMEKLGLSRRETWDADIVSGRFARNGALPVNPSGGSRIANAVFCNGLIRIAEAARQIRGSAGSAQLPAPKVALAHASSGFAMQYQTVVIFGADRKGTVK